MEAVPGDTPFCTITHTCNLEYAAQELFFTSLPCSPFYMKVLIPQSCPAACNLMDCSLPGNFCPWNSSGKNTGMGCHFLLQWIFPTQESNLGLPHCRQILYHLSHQGSSLVTVCDYTHGPLHAEGPSHAVMVRIPAHRQLVST